MMNFESFGYLFLSIPILFYFYWRYFQWQKFTIAKFNEPKLAKKFIVGFNPGLSGFRFFLLLFVITILIFSLANVQFSNQKVEPHTKIKQSFIFAVDVSNSMLVKDVLPSRLIKSKEILQEIVNATSESSIGIVVFAGKAYTYLPITENLTAVRNAINELDVVLVDRQGTSFGEALKVASSSFTKDQINGKNICLISDGENHLNNFKKIADSIRKSGINLISIAVGTLNGGEIPILGQNKIVMKNLKGEIIISKLNLEPLKIIAGKKDNIFKIADNDFPVNQFLASINNKKSFKMGFNNKVHHSLLWFAFALILFDILISPIKKILKFNSNKALKQ